MHRDKASEKGLGPKEGNLIRKTTFSVFCHSSPHNLLSPTPEARLTVVGLGEWSAVGII